MSGFDVPVAILNFNRPHLTRRVFEVVRQVKPRKLLLVADGPRTGRPDDARLCAEVRAIFDEIDWECEVHRKFSETNLGSFKSNSSGLNWIFDTVEEAIVIEDDCIPSLSFFPYCEELLARYRNEPKVGVITGYNLGFPVDDKNNESYFFSAYTLNWAWASWRRAWKQVDMDMSWWNPEEGRKMLKAIFPRFEEWRYWYKLYEQIWMGEKRNAWDYQLILSAFKNAQYCVIPNTNMVSNIGFGPEGTNCINMEGSVMHDVPRGEIEFPLVHPAHIKRSVRIDAAIFHIRFHAPQTLLMQLKAILLKSKLIRNINNTIKGR